MTIRLGKTEMDRCAGVLLGVAAGDALGAGYEFGPPLKGAALMIGGGLGPWEPGEWTDDTQMTICVAEEAATGSVDPSKVGSRFLDWFAGDPKDLGVQTRAVLGAAREPGALTATATERFARHPANSAGNGSLMRTAPLALAYLGDDQGIADAARGVSALTHGDPVAGEACVLWCIAIERAVTQGRLDGIWDGLAQLDPGGRARWQPLLKAAFTEAPATFNRNGYVVTALQAALAAIWQTPVPSDLPARHLADALQAAVRIGHDTDTVAAIAGALLGARWGSSAIPLTWRRILHGWPGYCSADLVRLGVLSARAGRPDSTGWPSAPDLGRHYATNWPQSPLAVPLPDDPGVILGNVAGLGEVTADVVVSLCRMGARQVPTGVGRVELWLLDEADPSSNPNLDLVLEDAASAILRWRDQGETVFVHCVGAQSRTPTVGAAYLMTRLGLPPGESLDRVRRVLPSANPNPGFRAALDRMGERPARAGTPPHSIVEGPPGIGNK